MATYGNKISHLVTFGAAGERFKNDMHVANSSSVESLEAATLLAIEKAKAGDIILLSPSTSSFDEFSGYEERGRVFKNIVNKYHGDLFIDYHDDQVIFNIKINT